MERKPRVLCPSGLSSKEFQLMTGEITPELTEFTKKFHDAFSAKQNVFLEKLSDMGSSFGRVIPVNESVVPTMLMV